MNAILNLNHGPMTMSSREIAELVGKQHSNIKISAERLADKGVIGTLATQEFAHNGNTYTEYLLNKRDSLVLVAQNCPEFTARLVDRWQQLEAQAAAPAPALPDFTDPAAAAIAWAEQYRAKSAAEAERNQLAIENHAKAEALAIAAPKAEALDRFATFAEGSMCITNAAKALGQQPKAFFRWLQEHQWIYRRAGGSGWLAYQSRIQVGYLDHKVTTVERSDGTQKVVEQVLVTAKGLAKLSGQLNLQPA